MTLGQTKEVRCRYVLQCYATMAVKWGWDWLVDVIESLSAYVFNHWHNIGFHIKINILPGNYYISFLYDRWRIAPFMTYIVHSSYVNIVQRC
jgi:hypothetical protein